VQELACLPNQVTLRLRRIGGCRDKTLSPLSFVSRLSSVNARSSKAHKEEMQRQAYYKRATFALHEGASICSTEYAARSFARMLSREFQRSLAPEV